MPGPAPIELSVRELAEFVLQTGDLGGRGFTSPLRALAGTKLHQKIQKERPESYQKEVRLEKRLTVEGVEVLLRGRVDGLIQELGHLWLEEIKTVQSGWPPKPNPVHWGQAKIYAALYGETSPYSSATLQLTYAHLHGGEVLEFKEEYTYGDLQAFFEKVMASYLQWIIEWEAWQRERNSFLDLVTFPHGRYRAGQRELSVKIYNSIRTDRRLLVNAPTGIGKTISALFPALKAMGKGEISKIFYLTSRTLGRMAAEKALKDLRQQGLRIRSVTLTAKNKICFNATENGCDTTTCPYAIGYYDRIHAAIRDLLVCEDISRLNVELIAQKHQVCPFELSLDAALWSDVIIGDYNYLFDPGVSLKRFFQEESRPYAFIIDEAHHLAERCREMFSATLNLASFTKIKSLRAAQSVAKELRLLAVENDPEPAELSEVPEGLVEAVLKFTRKAEALLMETDAEDRDENLLELYFESLSFLRTHDDLDARYRIWKKGSSRDLSLILDCVDPSSRIDQTLQQGKSAVLISATLLPLEYFSRILGARPNDNAIALDSPFDPENLGVFIADKISTDYKSRSSSYGEVAAMIHTAVSARTGNYLTFFPSYQYLKAVVEELEKLPSFARFLVQTPEMTELERETYLKEFQPGQDSSLVGFAVMGGIFGEAIDLTGDRLIGTIIVSVGLPQVCFERNLTLSYFAQYGFSGFDYAYTFPGYNRVLQAVGRVIRTETDRGITLLIDRRFSEFRYRKLMPPWWYSLRVSDSTALKNSLTTFWQKKPPSEPIRLDEPKSGA